MAGSTSGGHSPDHAVLQALVAQHSAGEIGSEEFLLQLARLRSPLGSGCAAATPPGEACDPDLRKMPLVLSANDALELLRRQREGGSSSQLEALTPSGDKQFGSMEPACRDWALDLPLQRSHQRAQGFLFQEQSQMAKAAEAMTALSQELPCGVQQAGGAVGSSQQQSMAATTMLAAERRASATRPDAHRSLAASQEMGCPLGTAEEPRLDVLGSADQFLDCSPVWDASFSESVRTYASTPSAFLERSNHWVARRAQKIHSLRRHNSELEVSECSFKPKCVARPRSSSTGRWRRAALPTCHGSMSARGPSHLKLEASRWAEKRAQEELQECTFKPDLSQSASSLKLSFASLSRRAELQGEQPSVASSAGHRGEWPARPASTTKSCTLEAEEEDASMFTPQTNAPAPHMVRARAYLKEAVFDRLSKAVSSGGGPLAKQETHSADHDLQADAIHEEDGGVALPGKACVAACRSPGRSSSVGWLSSVDTASEYCGTQGSEATLLRFLRRQNECEEARLRRLEKLEAEATLAAARPAISSNSRRLAELHKMKLNSGVRETAWSTPQVMAAAAAARGRSRDSFVEQAVAKEFVEEECSFCPSINAVSARRPARSVDELSGGDFRKREAKAKALRERLQHAREMEALRAEEPMLRECTFRPQVNSDAPSFVKHMAETYRAAKGVTERAEESQSTIVQRPEWR
eukprot:TRINITY_DN36242_c0_g1_i2.p1 TRINITY_DN36242_c0_g1~~TRINITY_DN36242_c0_g1_i2.p1  ORF type:complete len:696 (+),score=132.29 TRINITY_DN36242_c0_g1_i2:98-2185(+)